MSTAFSPATIGHAVGVWIEQRAGFSVAHAIEHMQDDGSVRIELWTHDDMVTIAEEGMAQSGRVTVPSYVITVAARVDS
jgi:hypothetical protein